ncbi:hypothetical protein IKG33_01345 [Candidatus Saccharibacteria bacterium]|nr:hypothetical protein [Candidatus Saccharibacteria bacterium]
MKDFNEQSIIHELKIDALGLGIPIGSAEIFIKRSLSDAKKTLRTKTIITEKDLERAILKELKKYHADLAYVYENRDKII